jgi:hypothetical protein
MNKVVIHIVWHDEVCHAELVEKFSQYSDTTLVFSNVGASLHSSECNERNCCIHCGRVTRPFDPLSVNVMHHQECELFPKGHY